jgi:hypothetical protein
MQKYFILPEGAEPTKENISEAIKFNEEWLSSYNHLDSYYIGDHAIKYRKKSISYKNNQIVVNHCKYISDINTGYLIGNPVDYQTMGGVTDEDIQLIMDAYKKQTIAITDTQVAKDASKFGRAYDYTFIGKNGLPKTLKIDPRNAIVVYRDPHFFGEVPIIEYENNDELQGDYEQVISLVNAYEFLTSDRINDKEQLVEAILVLKEFGLEVEQRDDLLTYRMLQNVPKDGGAEYISKSFNESQIEILRKAIENDIHKISMTPNMSDENFVGNSSGVAIAYKLLPFEQNIRNKERSLEKSLKQRLELYINHFVYLNKMPEVSIHDIDIVFKRNLPKNDYETSQMISNLRGLVSPETLISQLTFIKDPSAELESARESEMIGLNAEIPEFGTPDATLESLEEKGLVEANAKQNSLLSRLKEIFSGSKA